MGTEARLCAVVCFSILYQGTAGLHAHCVTSCSVVVSFLTLCCSCILTAGGGRVVGENKALASKKAR